MPTAERRKQPRPVSTEDDLARFHASVAGGNQSSTTTYRPETRTNTGSSNLGKEEPQPNKPDQDSEAAKQEMPSPSTICQTHKVADSDSPDVPPLAPLLWKVDGSDCEKLSIFLIASAIGLANGINLMGRKFNCRPKVVTFASEAISARSQTEIADRLHPTSDPELEEEPEGLRLVMLSREQLPNEFLLDPANTIQEQIPKTTEVLLVDTKRGDKSSDISVMEDFAAMAKRELPRLKLVVLVSRKKVSTCRSRFPSADGRSRFLKLQYLNKLGSLHYRLSIESAGDSASAKPVQFELIGKKDRHSQRWNWSRTKL